MKFTKILSSAKQHTEGPNGLEEGLKISENLISRKGGGVFFNEGIEILLILLKLNESLKSWLIATFNL